MHAAGLPLHALGVISDDSVSAPLGDVRYPT
jgi:hypothetical protein